MIDTPNDESSFYSSVEYCGVKKVPNRLIGKKFCGVKKRFHRLTRRKPCEVKKNV